MVVGKDIKIVMKTSIGMKISMKVIDPMIGTVLIIKKDYMAEMIHIVETGNIVEIDCKTTVEMSIRRKVINIREGLEIIMKMSMRTGMVGINMNANSEMTNMI